MSNATMYYSLQVTSLLVDLQQLLEVEEDEDDKAYLAAILQYYTKASTVLIIKSSKFAVR